MYKFSSFQVVFKAYYRTVLKNNFKNIFGLMAHVYMCCLYKVNIDKTLQGPTVRKEHITPSNAEATFIQSTRMQRFLKTISTLSCWY